MGGKSLILNIRTFFPLGLGGKKPRPPFPACVALAPCVFFVLDKPLLDGLHPFHNPAVIFVPQPVRNFLAGMALHPRFQNLHI